MSQKATKQGFTNALPPPVQQFAFFDKADIHAIKALFAGKATEDQQLRFVRWLERASDVNGNPFRLGEFGHRETDFAAGKKFVGDQFYAIVKYQFQSE